MNSVFVIDELYNKILSYLDKADSARAALVCKLWNEAAMNAVWETANFKIFRVLDSTLVERRGIMYFLVRHSTLSQTVNVSDIFNV